MTLSGASKIRVVPHLRSHESLISAGDLSGIPRIIDAISRAQPWATRAACRDSDVEFVHDAGSRRKPPPVGTLRCMQVCATCEVRRECLREALTAYQPSSDPLDPLCVAYGV